MSDRPHAPRLRPHVKSHIVGRARQADGTTTTAYRAVESLVCGQCGAEIVPGALFLRHTVQRTVTLVTSLARMPVCATCRPLQVEGRDERMTEQSGPDEPEQGMPPITWRPVVVPDLLEARIVTGDDGDGDDGLYVGYVTRTPGRGDKWHGYVGFQHESVGVGTREAVQAAVEQAARAAWAARPRRRDRGGEE